MKMRELIFVSLMLLLNQVVFAQQQGEVQQGSNSPAPESNQITQPQQGLQNLVQESQKMDKKVESQAKKDIVNNKPDVDKDIQSVKKAEEFSYSMYNSLGLNLSVFSGSGLSYRYHMGNPFLFQVSGGVISNGDEYFYSFGFEVQNELSKVKDKRAFGALAVGLYGKRYKEEGTRDYYTGMNPPEKWYSDNHLGFAAGVGGELAFGNSIVDSISLGCEIYPIGMFFGGKDEDFVMFPGGALYLFYNF